LLDVVEGQDARVVVETQHGLASPLDDVRLGNTWLLTEQLLKPLDARVPGIWDLGQQNR
jgi:hypothetical protein